MSLFEMSSLTLLKAKIVKDGHPYFRASASVSARTTHSGHSSASPRIGSTVDFRGRSRGSETRLLTAFFHSHRREISGAKGRQIRRELAGLRIEPTWYSGLPAQLFSTEWPPYGMRKLRKGARMPLRYRSSKSVYPFPSGASEKIAWRVYLPSNGRSNGRPVGGFGLSR
jgi:hypothetical protein